MEKEKYTVLGQIKSVDSRNLVSGDKQVTIKVIVVGAEVEEAVKFGNLQPGASVVLTHDPDLNFNL